MAVHYIPEGRRTVAPYLVVKDVPRVIEFLKQGFDGKEIERTATPDGTILCAEVQVGDSIVMMGEAHGERQPMPVMLYVYVRDADAAYRRALEAGGTSLMEPADMFYGDRNAAVKDPGGNQWWIATHKEDVPPAELAKRAAAHARHPR